jgi:hypothetical protein
MLPVADDKPGECSAQTARVNAVSQLIRDTVFVLSRLKDGKVIGVVDEDLPEEPRRQHTVESLCAGILLGAGEAEEGHAGQFE